MERNIGEQFDCNGVQLETVEEKEYVCKGCYFRVTMSCCDIDIVDILGPCSASEREDKKDIFFKEVYMNNSRP